MEIHNITNQFVSLSADQTRLGLVVGFDTRHPFGICARIFNLGNRKIEMVSLDDCRFVPKTDIIVPATVLKLFAWHKEFGQGVVTQARRPRQAMEVQLQNPVGTVSDWLPLEDVTVLGPKPLGG